MTALPELVALLEERIGLDAESIGLNAIERAVRERIAACAVADERAYWDRVRASEAELQELVETIVVPETWFFRDREALTALARLAHDAVSRRPDVVLHLLSLPCCTGEEPYSMAMALLDAGVAPERFRVDGADISARSLALARRATYGRNAFRGADLGFRGRYFEPSAAGHRLSDEVRACVQFRQDNLLHLELPRPPGGYDFIFCRNVLIYFAASAQRHALEALHRLLAPDGVVFVGPAETSLMVRHGYTSAKIPLAFAFRKPDEVAESRRAMPASAPMGPPTAPPAGASHRPTRPVVSPPPREPADATRVVPRRSAPTSVPVPAPASPLPPTPAPPPASTSAALVTPTPALRPTIADIERLADQGKLADAAAACQELLRDPSAGAGAYYLAGVVHGALGDQARAIEYYRKAIYLDPLHVDALSHLAYLLETTGDIERAEVLRDRARRARRERPDG